MAAQQQLNDFLLASSEDVRTEVVEGFADLEVQVLRRSRFLSLTQAPGLIDDLLDHRLRALDQLHFVPAECTAGAGSHQRQHRHGATAEVDEERHFLGQSGLLVIGQEVLAEVEVVGGELAQTPQPRRLPTGTSQVEGIQQVRPALIVVDIHRPLVRRERIEQRQWPVIAFVDKQHEMIDRADLPKPMAQPRQPPMPGRQVEQVGDTGGPEFQFLGAHGGYRQKRMAFGCTKYAMAVLPV
ncbi:hypothetical protein D3C73_992420 [compost metagenome]